MDLSKLDDEQIKVALKVIASAKKHGINPDFVLPMVNAESGFRPDASSGKAIGPMQLTPTTAKDLGVDPTNVDENIDGGMRFLKGLIENKKLGGDPRNIFAAYNAGPNHKFFETGDLKDLPDETVNHVVKLINTFGGQMPEMTQEPVAQEAPKAADSQPEEQYSGEPLAQETPQDQDRTAKEAGAIGAVVGTGLGSVYTAKMPVVRVAQRVGLLPGGKPISAEDAAKMAYSIMTPEGGTPGGKWGAKTGYGMGEGTVQEASSRYQRAMPQGKISSKIAKRFGPAMPGENPQLAQRLIDRSKLAEYQQATQNIQQMGQQAAQPDSVQRVVRNVMTSAPFKGGLAGLGMGFNLQDAYNQFQNKDYLSGVLSSGAAGASGLSLVPSLSGVAGPAAVGLTTASQIAQDLKRGDKQGAAESGLTGLTALMPRIFGPLAAALYSGKLNEDEEQELARRRALDPTISP